MTPEEVDTRLREAGYDPDELGPRFQALANFHLTYQGAYLLAVMIDSQVRDGSHHWRTRDGLLLWSLDQVVEAILSENLLLPAPRHHVAYEVIR